MLTLCGLLGRVASFTRNFSGPHVDFSRRGTDACGRFDSGRSVLGWCVTRKGRGMRQRSRTWPALLLVLVSAVLLAGQLPAVAAGTPQATTPTAVPAKTPQILDNPTSGG